jgi:hypothetical protein
MAVKNVKSSGTADRGHRRAEAAHLIEVGEISTDQRAEVARRHGEVTVSSPRSNVQRHQAKSPWLRLRSNAL